MEPCFVVLALALLAAPLAVAILALRKANAQAAALGRIEGEVARLRARIEERRRTGAAAATRWSAGSAAQDKAPLAEPTPAAVSAAVPAPAAAAAADRSGRAEAPGLGPAWAEAPSAPVIPPGSAPVVGAAALAARPAAPPTPVTPAAPRHAALEELLGVRLLLWVGAAALALAGAFLVKISFERGWISPSVRVAAGVAFGVVLLALGDRLRATASGVAQALSAAGIADLFTCFLAASSLYHLVSPAVGFTLMALTTAVGVGLSLRQGPIVAVIGLIGGLLTPALIRTAQPSARNLFAYLLLLSAGLLAVARRRGWWPLAAATLAGGLLWTLAWLAGPFRTADGPWLSLFLVAMAGAALVMGAPPPPARGHAPAASAVLAAITLAAALAGTALVAGASGYSSGEWAFVGLLAAGSLALAWCDSLYAGHGWVALATVTALLAAWGGSLSAGAAPRFLATAAAGAALFGGAGWAGALASGGALWRRVGRGKPPHPGWWAALSGSGALAVFVLAWGDTRGVAGVPQDGWGGAALVLALLYLAAAVPVARRRSARRELETALAALAVAVTSFVSLAAPLELHDEWLSVAWALETTALVWLAGRFRLRALNVLAQLLAAGVIVRLLLNPEVLTYARGQLPFWNVLLYAYGVPLVCFAAAARHARRLLETAQTGEGAGSFVGLASRLEWGAIAIAFAMVSLEIHHAFHPATPESTHVGLAEWATLANAWLLCGWAMLRADRRSLLPSLELAGRLAALLGMAAALFLAGFVVNPLWRHEPVGSTPVFNLLLWAYGAPAVAGALAAGEVRRRGGSKLPRAAGPAALLLAFLLVTLTVRQLFHGTFLDQGPGSAAERYAYSATWVLFGVVLLLAGILRRGKLLRYGSLAVMLLAVVKVFLYDTSRLSDLYRVLSFLGLGVSLLLLAYLYQRFVFREEVR
ncbi:MAG TPA: DUF2339 domain-containing protein [Thermoanaerobaculia bacterium]|nr:DUF2339 domain-containing protein [Thermoanaerobaculia bacterium]